MESRSRERRVPEIPPAGERIRLLVDTDAGCEIDDQYAVALALLMPERFAIEGFVAAQWGSPDTIDKTAAEVRTVMEKAGCADEYPVLRGAPPIQWYDFPEKAEGVDFIIERAMSGSGGGPLYVVSLGAATNIASAYMTEPAIAEHIVSVWHMRSQWPLRSPNPNVWMDVKAARHMFSSDLPLVLYDTGTYIRWTMEQSERRVRPHGPLGVYLHALRESAPGFRRPDKGFFDLGDMAFLADPDLAEWEIVDAPTLTPYCTYDFNRTLGKVMRVYHTSSRGSFELLCGKLAEKFPAA